MKAANCSGVSVTTSAPCPAKLLLHIRRLQDLDHRRVQLGDDVFGRAGWRKKALPRARLEPRQRGLIERGHVRKSFGALQAQHRLRAALVGHLRQLDPVQCLELLGRELDQGADAGIGEVEPVGFALGIGDQLRHRVGRDGRMHDEGVGREGDRRHRRKILDRIVAELGEQARESGAALTPRRSAHVRRAIAVSKETSTPLAVASAMLRLACSPRRRTGRSGSTGALAWQRSTKKSIWSTKAWRPARASGGSLHLERLHTQYARFSARSRVHRSALASSKQQSGGDDGH